LADEGGIKIGGQEIGDRCMVDSEHQIVPRENVIRKIEPAEIDHIVGNNQLLVIARRDAQKQRACRVGDAQADPRGREMP
jgi:hypothetical protein